jgi:twinkle protein
LSWAAYGYSALSVPYGGGGGDKQQWIESEYDRLDRFERIYLAPDMDGPGDEAAAEIANRLGHHRCLRVKMPRKDGNQCLVDGVPKEDMDRAIADATWFEIADLRLPSDFTERVTTLFWPREGERIGYRTPYGKLGDKLLFRPGEVTIWTGDSGAGKTQILNNCVVDWIAQGGRTCLSSLEMHPAFTLKRMTKQIIGSDRPTEAAIKAALEWANTGLLIYELTGKQKVEELLTIFDYGRSRYGCDQFVIDSLMRLGIAGDDYNSQEAVIFRIVDWAMASNVHVHLVAHAKKGERDRGVPGIEDIKGAMELGANAFNIVSVWRNRKFEDQIAKLEASGDAAGAAKLRDSKPGVILNVAKQRNGDFEGKIGLWFDQKTNRYRSSSDEATWRRTYLPEDWNAAA